MRSSILFWAFLAAGSFAPAWKSTAQNGSLDASFQSGNWGHISTFYNSTRVLLTRRDIGNRPVGRPSRRTASRIYHCGSRGISPRVRL